MSDTVTIKTIIVQANQSLADIAVQEYGTVEGMVLILQANPGLGISDELTPGMELIIPGNTVVKTPGTTTEAAPEPVAAPIQQITITNSPVKLSGNYQAVKTITVQAGQSLADIALQEYGTFEGVILILQANPGLSVSDTLTGGQELNLFTGYTVNLVKELVKVEPYASALQSLLAQWAALIKFPSSGITEEGDPVFMAWLATNPIPAQLVPQDGIMHWDGVKYLPYASKKTVDPGIPYFYSGNVGAAPTFTNQLMLDGQLTLRSVNSYGPVVSLNGQEIISFNSGSLIIQRAGFNQVITVYNGISIEAVNKSGGLNGSRVYIGDASNLLGNSDWVVVDLVNRVFDIAMPAIKLSKGTANKYYGTDANKNLVPMPDPMPNPVVNKNGLLTDILSLGAIDFTDNGESGCLYITLNQNGTLRRAKLAVEVIPDPVISDIVISNITDDGFTATCQIDPFGTLTPVLHYGETMAYGLTVVGNLINSSSSVSFIVSGVANFADCFIKVVAGGTELAYVGQLLVKNAWYGIERDITVSSPDWTRIGGDMTLHASLPVQSSLKGVLLNADKTVNYYLKADDWTKKADGTASVLTGADGNVMVRKDADTYWKFETDGNIQRVKCSMFPLTGYSKIDKWNIGAYEAKLVSTKLSSVSGVLPTTSRSETQYRADARANGAGYNQQWNEPFTEIVWMFIVEYATNNFQKAVNATLTAQGYKQGGLGNGVSTAVSAEWSAFNAYNPFIIAGSSDSLANGSGEVPVVIANFGGAGINRTFTVPRYRGIENLYGHIWKWVDGVSINHLATTREVWIFDDPALIVDNTSVNARLVGLLAPASGYGKTMIFDAKGCILPATVGGGSTTYLCDYLYVPALNSGWRALLSGGDAANGAAAGPLYATTNNGASLAHATIGARLFAR